MAKKKKASKAARPTAAPLPRVKGSGILLRLLEMHGDEFSIVEGVVQPGAEGYDQRHVDTKLVFEPRGPGAEMIVDNETLSLGTTRSMTLDRGQWHRMRNPSPHPWSFKFTMTPPWNPNRAFVRFDDREVPGSEMWFEVRTYVGDEISRAKFRLRELSAGKGLVDVLLAPGAISLVEYHLKSISTFTGVQGEGVLRLDGKPRRIKPGDAVVVEPGVQYQFRNTEDQPWLLSGVHTPQWEPADTVYVSTKGARIPGDQVWFEVGVPE